MNKVYFVFCTTLDPLRMHKYKPFLAENSQYANIANMGTHCPVDVLWHLTNTDLPIIAQAIPIKLLEKD